MNRAAAAPIALITLVLLAGAIQPAAAQETATVLTAGFDTTAGGLLRVNVPDADVVLRTGDSDRVEITVRLTSKDMDRARSRFESMNLQASGDADGVSLTGDKTREWNWNRRNWGSFNIEAEITLPARYDVDLETSDGDIQAGRLQGAVALRTSDGDIRIASIEGTTVSIHSSDGDIQVGEVTASEVTLNTSDGDISSSRIAADRIEAATSDGDIDLTVAGALEARTSDGDIDVVIERAAEIWLRSGDGDIHITGPASLGANLDLDGEDLEIPSGITLDGTISRRRVQGALNGGGPGLRARTGDGTLTLSLSGDA